jgi:hypothetical protein
MRFRPCLQALVELEVAVFVVPGNRMALRGQVHPDLVGAAGLDGDLQQVKPAAAWCATLTSVMERMPSGSSRAPPARGARRRPAGTCAAARRSPCGWRARHPGPAPDRSCRFRARGTGPAASAAPTASWPPAGCPRFRGPAGAPVPGTGRPAGPGAAARSRQNSRRCRRAPPRRPACRWPAGARLPAGPGIRAPARGAATLSAAACDSRTGGTRTTSPAATRVSAAARPLFTRTSPLRMMR